MMSRSQEHTEQPSSVSRIVSYCFVRLSQSIHTVVYSSRALCHLLEMNPGDVWMICFIAWHYLTAAFFFILLGSNYFPALTTWVALLQFLWLLNTHLCCNVICKCIRAVFSLCNWIDRPHGHFIPLNRGGHFSSSCFCWLASCVSSWENNEAYLQILGNSVFGWKEGGREGKPGMWKKTIYLHRKSCSNGENVSLELDMQLMWHGVKCIQKVCR